MHTPKETALYIQKTQRLLFKNYCYIIEHTSSRDALLIDPAWEFQSINNQIKVSDLNPIAVLLTHHHKDHVNLAEKFASLYNIPVYMSSDEINYYRFNCKNLQALPDKNEIQIGPFDIECISTPGHTFGSICYLIENQLFSGDTLFIEGCGICFGKGASPEKMFYSLQKLKKKIHDTTLIYPGHRFTMEIGQSFMFVKENNIYLHIDALEHFVNFRMRKQNWSSWFNFS